MSGVIYTHHDLVQSRVEYARMIYRITDNNALLRDTPIVVPNA